MRLLGLRGTQKTIPTPAYNFFSLRLREMSKSSADPTHCFFIAFNLRVRVSQKSSTNFTHDVRVTLHYSFLPNMIAVRCLPTSIVP